MDLKDAMNATLKKIGQFQLCLDAEDLELLTELKRFLSPFRDLTRLVSECSPHLSFVPLMVQRIQIMCSGSDESPDSTALKKPKKLVNSAVVKRLAVNKLVKLSCCLNPSVRDAVLSHDDCGDLLQQAYRELKQSSFSSTLLPTPADLASASAQNPHMQQKRPMDDAKTAVGSKA